MELQGHRNINQIDLLERSDEAFSNAKLRELDQGALGMSDPLGPLQLALKPNSASSINRPLLNFYYCAH